MPLYICIHLNIFHLVVILSCNFLFPNLLPFKLCIFYQTQYVNGGSRPFVFVCNTEYLLTFLHKGFDLCFIQIFYYFRKVHKRGKLICQQRYKVFYLGVSLMPGSDKIWIMNSTETAAAPFIANQTSNITEYECEEPYPNQTEILKTVSWWLEGFSQIIIGCLGFAGNAIAIPVLSHRKLSSIFNRILVFLAGTLIKDFFF